LDKANPLGAEKTADHLELEARLEDLKKSHEIDIKTLLQKQRELEKDIEMCAGSNPEMEETLK
jgi:hypothetical protein